MLLSHIYKNTMILSVLVIPETSGVLSFAVLLSCSHVSRSYNALTEFCFSDLSSVGSSSLRANGNLSPRILDLRGGGRRKSGFNFD